MCHFVTLPSLKVIAGSLILILLGWVEIIFSLWDMAELVVNMYIQNNQI